MKKFDLEKAKAGAPVCTRDGRPVRILCYDLKGGDYPIVACAERDNVEIVILCTADGHLYDNGDINSFDLMMADIPTII